jgi:hypothetical protein
MILKIPQKTPQKTPRKNKKVQNEGKKGKRPIEKEAPPKSYMFLKNTLPKRGRHESSKKARFPKKSAKLLRLIKTLPARLQQHFYLFIYINKSHMIIFDLLE